MGRRKLFDSRKNADRRRMHQCRTTVQQEFFIVRMPLNLYYSAVSSDLLTLRRRISTYNLPSGSYTTIVQGQEEILSLSVCRDNGNFPFLITIRKDFTWSFTVFSSAIACT